MRFPPGTDFGYTHAGFILLGEALMRASGRPLEDLARTQVLEPLGLANTGARTETRLAEPVLHAYTTERGVYENSTFWNPSWTSHTGFLTGDMPDLLRLARAFGSGELLSPESHAAQIAPDSVGKAGNRPDRYFGLGIVVMGPWIMQMFSFGGYGGTVGYLPSEDLAIAVVITQGPTSDPDTNWSTPVFDALREAVLR